MKCGIAGLIPVVLLASLPALGATITFEDLTTRSSFYSLGISNSYQGYVWSPFLNGSAISDTGWASATVASPAVAPAPTPVSGTSYAWNWNGPQSLFIQFGGATDFTSAYLATLSSAYQDSASTVQLFGYDALDSQVAAGPVLRLTDSFQLYSANFSQIHKVEFRADSASRWFSIDDITLDANSQVPEPGSAFLLLLGGLALVAIGRRRRGSIP